MINLSLNELKLIAQNRNISDYESKSEKDLIKDLRWSKPKIRINKKKMKEIRKDFDELRFSKKEINKYRKVFYNINNYTCLYAPNIKNYRHISESEIEDTRKNLK